MGKMDQQNETEEVFAFCSTCIPHSIYMLALSPVCVRSLLCGCVCLCAIDMVVMLLSMLEKVIIFCLVECELENVQ